MTFARLATELQNLVLKNKDNSIFKNTQKRPLGVRKNRPYCSAAKIAVIKAASKVSRDVLVNVLDVCVHTVENIRKGNIRKGENVPASAKFAEEFEALETEYLSKLKALLLKHAEMEVEMNKK